MRFCRNHENFVYGHINTGSMDLDFAVNCRRQVDSDAFDVVAHDAKGLDDKRVRATAEMYLAETV